MSACVGAALTGLRPVGSISFVEFTMGAMDEIVNQAAKLRYMFGGQVSVPMVLRASDGTLRSSAAQHSESFEAIFAHVPGLKVVAPSTPADAKGLLAAAIADDDPVIYLENKKIGSTRGSGSGGRPRGPARAGGRAPAGLRRHRPRLLDHGATRRAGLRGAGRGGDRRRARRPAQPRAARSRDGARVGRQDAARRRLPRGVDGGRLRRGGGRAHHRGAVRRAGGAGRPRRRADGAHPVQPTARARRGAAEGGDRRAPSGPSSNGRGRPDRRTGGEDGGRARDAGGDREAEVVRRIEVGAAGGRASSRSSWPASG